MDNHQSKQGTASYGRGRGSHVEKRKRLYRHLGHALKLARALGEDGREIAQAIEPFVEADLRRSLERFEGRYGI